jgi:hypothetical protein
MCVKPDITFLFPVFVFPSSCQGYKSVWTGAKVRERVQKCVSECKFKVRKQGMKFRDEASFVSGATGRVSDMAA